MKRAEGSIFQAFALDPASGPPLYRQLYLQLRDAMLVGAIPAGSRLPSTRAMAEDLGLSRNTVGAAFERLVDAGFVESRVGDGSYVSAALAEGWGGEDKATLDPGENAPSPPKESRRLSRRGRDIAGSRLGLDPLGPRPFSVGVPALDAFPLATWQRLASREARQLGAVALQHGEPAGQRRLRELIASYLATSRGVRASAEQVLILTSAQMGLDLSARLLTDPGDAVWIEEPGYLGARGALTAAGAQLVPVPVDGEGLIVEAGVALSPAARLSYVSPSHQFPMGEPMSLRRRLRLLAWAAEAGAWILEDDYDCEYAYHGKSDQALQGLDRSGRVLYIGTFSKVLFPALRVAYIVVPEDLVEAFRSARFLADGHVAPATQEILTEFIEAGHFTGHLRRMRSLYRRRRDVLLEELGRRFGDLFRISSADTGMHVTARLAEGDDHQLAAQAAALQLELTPLSRYYLGPKVEQGFALGYAHVPEEEIVRACGLLQKIF